MADLTLKQKQEVKQEVAKQVEIKLHQKLVSRARSSAIKFKSELKKHTSTAIAAAFAFLIALSWREPIKASVDSIIAKLNLTEGGIYIQYLSAIIITIIAVFALILISKWTAEPEKKEQ